MIMFRTKSCLVIISCLAIFETSALSCIADYKPNGNSSVCTDIDECNIYGICSQKCENTLGSYKCLCDNGYSLQRDGRSCKSTSNNTLLLYSSGTEIHGFNLQTGTKRSMLEDRTRVIAIDFDREKVYGTDVVDELIFTWQLNETTTENLVTVGLDTPDGIAVDWVTGNIYFTDVQKQHIAACTNDGNVCTVLNNKDIDHPRAIVLNPEVGVMYWTDWGNAPKIAKSNMDGTEDVALITTDVKWPNGLAIDMPNKRIYWVDGLLNIMESAKLDGSDRRAIYKGAKHFFSNVVFEDKVYFSDWFSKSLKSVNKFTGDNITTLISGVKIFGIQVYDLNLKPKMPNPCFNSICSDMCLISGPQQYVCACPMHKMLSSNKQTCEGIESRLKIAIAGEKKLIQITIPQLGNHDPTEIPIDVDVIGPMAYNPIQNSMFIADVGARAKIILVNLKYRYSRILIQDNIGEIKTMCFDYLGNNLYWANDSNINVLSLATMTSKLINTASRKILSMVCVPEDNKLIVAEMEEIGIAIVKMNLDGTGKKPLSIGLLRLDSIFLQYDTHSKIIIITFPKQSFIKILDIMNYEEIPLWATLEFYPLEVWAINRTLVWFNKAKYDDTNNRIYWLSPQEKVKKVISLDDFNIEHITLITPDYNIPAHKCLNNNGQCSHICFPQGKRFECVCPRGMYLSSVNRSLCIRNEDTDKRIQETEEDNYVVTLIVVLTVCGVFLFAGVYYVIRRHQSVQFNHRHLNACMNQGQPEQDHSVLLYFGENEETSNLEPSNE